MSEFFEVLEQRVWPFVNRPARYIGNEYGLVRKAPESVRLRAAFVYPDLYEVGMSNLGLKVLYRVANSIDSVAAERSFVPWPDMEKLMRLHGVPLYSLETYSALSDFDLLGITLQSELTYTNVLAVLDLAGIPLESGRRDSGRWPLVAGGGPCAVNVRPLERFFDFFLLGDGEDAFREIAGALLSLETDGKEYTRAGKLEVLGSLEGVYVPPGRTGSPGPVRVRRVFDLKTSDAPDGLPVPLIEVAQHNYVVELMRGCTVGCRFCQAGMYYRPVRVRPPGQVADLVRQGVRSGGWESVTLLSLSSADYPAIEELVDELMPEIQGSGLTLSFPSLRVDESTLRLLERISGAKRSGLTFAVEAGSERLRRVIGKKVIEDDLVNLVTRVFTSGWTLVKLYFMVGLPTETGQDVDDIARLINRMAAIGRSVPGRHNVNVTLSPFVPKPCTPFQWEAQDDPGSILEKFDRIRSQVRTRRVRFKCHDPWAAVIEGVLCRGGSELGSVLRTAWAGGARLDGWSEHFDFAVWEKAFQEHGLDWRALLAETSDTMELPWKTVDAPVTESFLKQQREAGLQGQIVRDCDGGPCL
ncbi:MAG: TIGR03960 family B12-binding radical SAM protein, partial [Gemmatimonadota bacterium]|nr:TIGR03960 family B12-binding radical SAM protein [Gemmatimonadota bacterium]